MTTATLPRKAAQVSKGRHQNRATQPAQPPVDAEPVVPEGPEIIAPLEEHEEPWVESAEIFDEPEVPVPPAPKARFETPPCAWCSSERTEVYSERKGETESRIIIDPSGTRRCVDVIGIAKYCRCKRCRHTWKQFFESVRLS